MLCLPAFSSDDIESKNFLRNSEYISRTLCVMTTKTVKYYSIDMTNLLNSLII